MPANITDLPQDPEMLNNAAEEPQPTKPSIKFYATSDRMELSVELERTGTLTLDPEFGDIMAAIAEQGVVYGINTNAVNNLCYPPRFNSQVVVARGNPAETGADGYLKFLVETDRKLQPKERPDGTVDFRDLGFIQNVEQGQPLCEVHPPAKGVDGMDIYGNELEGKLGKPPKDPAGKNTEYNEDRTVLLAAVGGSVEVKNQVACVIELLRINGNVDNSTGDIIFIGDISISGDVVSGFKVVSLNGSIAVKGSVEGATIEAAGDVTINEGVNGMDRGSIRVGGNLKCRYIQSCFVKTGKNIYAESVMYCVVECGGNMEMSGEKSRLIAGRTTVSGYLKAGKIGTHSHIPTLVTINSGAMLEKEIRERNERLKEMDKEELTIQQLFARMEDLHKRNRLTKDMLPDLEMARNTYAQLMQERERVVGRLTEAKAEQLELQTQARDSYIECRGGIHSGVTIVFGPLSMVVQQSFVNSRVMIDDGEIKIMTM